MTLDDLANKMDEGFKVLGDKLEFVNLTIGKHTVSLSGHDREIREIKDNAKELEHRIARVEIYVWLSLGAGLASGVGIAKFLIN